MWLLVYKQNEKWYAWEQPEAESKRLEDLAVSMLNTKYWQDYRMINLIY